MAIAFRIATFNLENLDDDAEGPALAARIAVLRPQLLRLEADILCLQEVNGQPGDGRGPRILQALDRLLDSTPYAGFARVATTGRDGVAALDVHNLVILSRFPIRASAQIHHQLVAPPHHRLATAAPPADAADAVIWDRPLLHAEIELAAGRRLHVLNLHLRAPLAAFVPGQKESAFVWKSAAGWAEGFFLAAVKRAGQALEARLLVERLFDADSQALVAVCGDMNADLREMPTRILCADPADTGNAALAARALAPAEGPAGAEVHFSVRHGARRAMLDHLLVSRGLAPYCRRSEVHNEGLADETAPDAPSRPESFHAPVVAEFALPR
jgi:endonuclease/exonuclease/phosphatase family metal-dependent hydrolase